MEKINLLTIDVEDWSSSSLFLLSNHESKQARQYLPSNDPQVEKGIENILELLAERDIKATFFVLAFTAQNHRSLIRQITNNGHEIASHTITHTLLTELSQTGLIREITDSKNILEDITGSEVKGFRAPNLTGYPETSYFFNQLMKSGYRYDSSYTTESFKPGSELESGIKEVPVTLVRHLIRNVPLGGTYLKIMQPSRVSTVINRENQQSRPAVLYVHPYELSGMPVSWHHPSPSRQARFSLILRNIRKDHHMRMLNYLFKNHQFTSIQEYLKI